MEIHPIAGLDICCARSRRETKITLPTAVGGQSLQTHSLRAAYDLTSDLPSEVPRKFVGVRCVLKTLTC
jgi:hypothetical protein